MNLEGFLTAFRQKTPWGLGTDADELALRLFRRLDGNDDGSIEVRIGLGAGVAFVEVHFVPRTCFGL
jgi:hypothetical protein